MEINSRAELDSTLRRAWADGEELRLSFSILDFIANHPATAHIPYARLQQLAREQHLTDPLVVERVVQYLTGAEGHVLDLRAELIDENDDVHRLDEEEFQLAVTEHIHPLTGSVDPGLLTKLFVYFRPSRLARQVLWNSDGE